MCDTWLLHTIARTSEVNNDTCKVVRLCRYVYQTFTSISRVGEEMIFSYYIPVSKSAFYDSLRYTTYNLKPFYKLHSSLLASPASNSAL